MERSERDAAIRADGPGQALRRRRRPSTGSTSRSRPGPCAACSGPTARARRRRSGSSRRSSDRMAGRAEVAGHDVVRAPGEVRRRIGLVGQHAALDESLSGRENLVMFGRLFHIGTAARRAAGRRAAGAVRARGGGGPAGQAVLRRDAPAARPRGQPDPGAGRPVPRRADDRASTRAVATRSGRPSGRSSARARRCC